MSRSNSTSWPSVPDSMQASFAHDPLSTNSQSRLTSDPSNYQLSSRSDPSRARRVQDPFAIPKYIKRLQAHGTRRRRSNTDGRVSLDASTEIDNPPTSVGDAVEDPHQEGETIFVDQDGTISVEKDNVGEESVCKDEPGVYASDEGDAPGVREQESRVSSLLIEEHAESGSGATPNETVDEFESVDNNAANGAIGDALPSNDRASGEVSERAEDPSPDASGNDLGNAQSVSHLSDRGNASDGMLGKDKDLDENEPLDEEAGEDVPKVTNPRKQRKKQGKRRSSQRKHIIDSIIGHRLGPQQKPEFLVKWQGYTETTWEPGSNLREDVPWLLIDYLEENIVYRDVNNDHSEPSPKRQKTSHPTAMSEVLGRSRLRKLPSRPDIMMGDTEQALKPEQESTPTTPADAARRSRGRPPRVETPADDDTIRRTRGRPRKSPPSSQHSTPIRDSQQSLQLTESGIEQEPKPGRGRESPLFIPQPEALLSEPESHQELQSIPQSEASFSQQMTPAIQSRSPQPRNLSEMEFDSVVEERPIQTQEPVSHLLQPRSPPPPPPDPIPSPIQHRLVAPVAPMGMGPFIS